jgi:hypothetical protein
MYGVYKHDATNMLVKANGPSLVQCLGRVCAALYNEKPLHLYASAPPESDKCILVGKLMLFGCFLTDFYSVHPRLNSRLGHNHVFCPYLNSTFYYDIGYCQRI